MTAARDASQGYDSRATGTGVVETTKAWAYCNACQWTGPDRKNLDAADHDLSMHKDTPGHYAHRAVQVACDRCTQGVMDAGNPHLHGLCRCPCHGGQEGGAE